MSTLNLTRVIILFYLLSASISAHAFALTICGLSPAYWASPIWQNTDVKLRILKADFTAPEIDRIENAIDRYKKQSIGTTYLNITLDTMPSEIELAMIVLNNDTTLTPNQKDATKWATFQFDEYHTIYKRSHLLSATPGVYVTAPGEDDVDEDTSAWTELRLQNENSCATSIGVEYWHESLDIIVARPAIAGSEGGTVSPANASVNLYDQPSLGAGAVDIDFVVAHEIGHFTGLDHPDDPFHMWNYQYKPTIMLENYKDPQGGPTNFGDLAIFVTPERYTQPLGDDLVGIRHMYPYSTPAVYDVAVNAWEYGDAFDFAYQFKARPQYLYNSSGFGPDPKATDSIRALQWAGFTPVSMHNLGTEDIYIAGDVKLGSFGPKKGFGANVNIGAYVQQSRDLVAPANSGPNKRIHTLLDSNYDDDDVPLNNIDSSYTKYDIQP